MMNKKEISMVKNIIRKHSRYRKTVNELRKRCKVYLPTGEFTKKGKAKTKMWNKCENCGHLQEKDLDVDHVVEIGTIPKQPNGQPDWNIWIPLVICDISNLQGLCKPCHDIKTKAFNTKGAVAPAEFYL